MENKENSKAKSEMLEEDIVALGAALAESKDDGISNYDFSEETAKAKKVAKIAFFWLVGAISFMLASILTLFIISNVSESNAVAETVIAILFAVSFLGLGVFVLINYKLMKVYSEWKKGSVAREIEEYHQKYGTSEKRNKKK